MLATLTEESSASSSTGTKNIYTKPHWPTRSTAVHRCAKDQVLCFGLRSESLRELWKGERTWTKERRKWEQFNNVWGSSSGNWKKVSCLRHEVHKWEKETQQLLILHRCTKKQANHNRRDSCLVLFILSPAWIIKWCSDATNMALRYWERLFHTHCLCYVMAGL